MKKIVIAPDSFKGTLSAAQICGIIKSCVLRHFPECAVCAIPVADGGEGSVECFMTALGGELITADCTGPHFEAISACYAILPEEKTGGTKTAVIEMAAAAGMKLAGSENDPSETTTIGVGELMLDAMENGCRKLILGLGGSCTNDFGCGALTALGVRFLDAYGREFIPMGKTLHRIAHIDTTYLSEHLAQTEITVMCDVDNPVFGENGAAYVFAPQKGADSRTVELLDSGLRHVCSIIDRQFGRSLSDMPGGGAAGAMAAGICAFTGARLISGIDTVLDTVNFDDIIKDADMIFTGEGLLDGQSLRGKVIDGIAKRAGKAGVPVIAVVGGAKDAEIQHIYTGAVSAVFTISRLPLDLSVSAMHSAENLSAETDNILRLIKLIENMQQI